MRVADVRDVVDAVQVRIALLVVHILAFAFHDLQWRLLEEQGDRFAGETRRVLVSVSFLGTKVSPKK